jgi:hypothetical protein
MTTTFSRASSTWLALAMLTLLTPLATEAQRRRPRQPATASWPSISIGVKAGYDNNANAEVLGAQLRVPLLRNGSVNLMPSADVTFLRGLKAYQYNIEALYLLAGRQGGPYFGGGLAFRNTIYGANPNFPRETRRGYSIVVGATFGGAGSFRPQLEARWVFLSKSDLDEFTPVNPRVVTFGINIPLTGRSARREGSGS